MQVTCGELRTFAAVLSDNRHDPDEIGEVVVLYTAPCPNGFSHPHVFAVGTISRDDTKMLVKDLFDDES